MTVDKSRRQGTTVTSVEWFSILTGLLSLPASVQFIVSWFRNRRKGVPTALRRTVAGALAIIYLGWVILDLLGSTVLVVNAARLPGFLDTSTLAYNIVLGLFFLFVTVLLPGGAVGLVVSKLDPEHWPGARPRNEFTKNKQPPYIQTFEKVACPDSGSRELKE